MSLGKEIQSRGQQPCLTAVQDNGSREASASVMVIAADEGGCRLIKTQLEQQNFPALFTSARNNDELQLAVNAGDWDIVLIDLPVPSLDLPEVLDYFRLRMPFVPVILLASRPDEARARELLPRGSWDYVLKDSLDRLVPAIDRSLRRSLLQRRAAAVGTVPEKRREPMIEQNGCRSDIADSFKGSDASAREVPVGSGVAEYKQLEQQLRQAQKMAAMGQLTSGIVHEFNNILTAIVGYASLLSTSVKPDDPANSLAEHILATADQAAKLIRSLLTFGRKQETDFRVVDVNEIIQRTGKLIRLIMGCKADLRVSTAARQLLVNADQSQIEQVLINLAINACDAMPDGGTLSIETDVVSGDLLDEATLTMREHCAVITVTDTGVGMDEKTRERIFEPFFTTKEAERGTGLGLSIVAGTIQQHKGAVRCESRPGSGTRFRIYLPLLAFQRKPARPGPQPDRFTTDKKSA